MLRRRTAARARQRGRQADGLVQLAEAALHLRGHCRTPTCTEIPAADLNARSAFRRSWFVRLLTVR
jgi:hypothetical protein